MARAFTDVDTGIEICEGIPGSGKSLFGVKRALTAVIEQRRPVYTNLPFRWRVVKAWLRNKGGADLAKLLIPLTHEHFLAYVSRAAIMQRERDSARLDCDRAGRVFLEEPFRLGFFARHGPHVVLKERASPENPTPPDPNWCSPMSEIIIDEGQHWFPADDKLSRKETPDLQSWATMHRHHRQRVLILSQNRMQVSLTFRRQARSYWICRGRAEERMVWGLRWKHLGLKPLWFGMYTKEQEEGKVSLDQMEPIDQQTIFPSMRWHRWYYRLYTSFTHGGSERQMKRDMVAMREQLGLKGDGSVYGDERTKGQPVEPITLRRRASRLMIKGGILASVLLLAYGLGRGAGGTGQAPPSAAAAAELTWGTWTGKGRDYVRIDGKKVGIGGVNGGAVLVSMWDRGRMSLWRAGPDFWLWKYGTEGPKKLGSSVEVVDAIRSRIALARGGGSGGESASGGQDRGTVGVAEGLDVRDGSTVLPGGG
jgi:hypothetical protein